MAGFYYNNKTLSDLQQIKELDTFLMKLCRSKRGSIYRTIGATEMRAICIATQGISFDKGFNQRKVYTIAKLNSHESKIAGKEKVIMKSSNKEDRLKRVYKSNYRRVLLTEVLPYEVPILLTNEGFYSRSTEPQEEGLLSAILRPGKETHPFTYKIVKTASSYRTLHLIHPSCQQDFINFYKTYSSLLCGLTARSEFSLRAPAEVAAWYYEPDNSLRDNSVKMKEPKLT